ncbi:unnamed protein product [Adineta ricciae]|uniref:Uncharacterized protein n=1 Tax=Adineta ricciae TaxID=249248 RepID=A0A815L693_ADIRI|nr:unnamed protein product [Adineta ricciae]CAF1406260.1 unnamed protein product [Adineta ricciae]
MTELLFDGQFDCLDGSGEQLKLDQQLCYQTLSMNCEEHLPCADLIRLYIRLKKEISHQQPFDIKHELTKKCNGQADCADGSDEEYQQVNWKSIPCAEANDAGCQLLQQANDMTLVNNEFTFKYQDLCNSFWHARHMASMKCPPNWSQYDRNDTALQNGNCIPPRSICDDEWNAIDGYGKVDCLGGQDESNRYCQHPANLLTKRYCKPGIFDCALCISRTKCKFSRSSLFKRKSTRCNKLKECPRYGSDEQTCHAPVTSKDKYSTKAKKAVVKITKSDNEDYDYTIDDQFVWACDCGIPIEVIRSRTLQFVCLCPSSSWRSIRQ